MNKISGADGLGFAPLPAIEPISAAGESNDPSFAEILQDAVEGVSGALHEADVTATEALVGEAAPHEAMIAISKADLQFRLMTQTRNKLVNAYQELMNLRM